MERKSAQNALQEEKAQRQQTALRQERSRLREEEARVPADGRVSSAGRESKRSERESRRALRQQREEAWRRQRQAAAASRVEQRFRLRDPIRAYALAGGKSEAKQSDWHLVVDYHKGVHGLELSAPFQTDSMDRQGSSTQSQRLKATEGNVVFEFDLVVPEDLGSLVQLPIMPGHLCEGF